MTTTTAVVHPSWCDQALCDFTDFERGLEVYGVHVRQAEQIRVTQTRHVDGSLDPRWPDAEITVDSRCSNTPAEARALAAELVRIADMLKQGE